MAKQTALGFSSRKKSSRTLRVSKYLNEKENELCCSPTRHSSRIRNQPTKFYSISDEEDQITVSDASPVKPLTPSKRKNINTKEHTSPSKVKCQTEGIAELTPSTRLTSLSLDSPEIKPLAVKPLSPEKVHCRELFPDKPTSVKIDCKFQTARLALHTSSTDNLPGRESELAELKEFFTTHIKNKTSGSIYISGPPGTGKTACLTHLMNQKEIKGCFQTVYINCTAMKSPAALYSHITSQLNLKIRGRPSEKSYLTAIEKHLASKRNLLLFVFDELDQLESRGQSVLYTVFEWPVSHPQGLVLVGIANALDLTDRTLPRLRAREDLTPRLLHFAPYSRQQIINILRLRLEEAGVGDLFSAPALQMLASKVATVSGDVRRALDIGRRVIELTGNPFLDNPQPVPVKSALKPTENQIHVVRSPTKSGIALRSPLKNASPSKVRSPSKFSSPSKLSSPSKFSSSSKLSPPRQTRTSPRKPFLSPMTSPSSDAALVPDPESPRRASSRKLFLSPSKSAPVPAPESPRRASPRKLFRSPVRKTVDLKEVMTVVGEVFGSGQSIGSGADELPLQQRLAVCSLMLILKNGKSKDVSVAKLHEVYRRVCNKRRLDPLDQAAFLSMLSLVEARGLLSLVGKGKPSRLSKVCLKWVEDEVVAALKDKNLLASILKDVACLS